MVILLWREPDPAGAATQTSLRWHDLEQVQSVSLSHRRWYR